MENIISILGITIWPFITFIAIILFRTDIKNVLRRLVSVETSTAKMIFNEEIREIEKSSSNIHTSSSEESREWLSEMIAIAKINPRAAIMEAWTSIEITCFKIGLTQGTAIQRFSPKALENFLYEIKDFDKDMIKQVYDLRRLRNRVIHGLDADFNFVDAEKYIDLADKIVSSINAAHKLDEPKEMPPPTDGNTKVCTEMHRANETCSG